MEKTVSTLKATPHLEFMPVALFGSVMGLTGLSVAWHLASVRYGVSRHVADAIAAAAILTFIAVASGYVVKFVTAFDAVLAEFHHPIAGNMFATFFVSLLLLPILIAPVQLQVARIVWVIGAVGMLIFAINVVSRWLSTPHEPPQATPAWIIPVVGLLDLPLAVPYLDLPHAQMIMLSGLSVGIFFALPLFTIVFARLIFAPPLVPALQPSLMILVAPFAVGMTAYAATVRKTDLFSDGLYVLTLFLLVVLIGRLRHLGSCCPFKFGWWSVSFPLSACSICALRFAMDKPGWLTEAIAICLLALVTAVIGWMLGRTLLGLSRGELRTLST